MKIYTMEQHLLDNSTNPDWLDVRAGHFTGSDFSVYMGDIDKAKTEQEINNLFYEWSKIYVKGTDDYKTLYNKSFERKKQIVGA